LPEDIQAALRPGMSSTATITTDTKNNVLAVPLESIVEKAPTPAASPAGGQVANGVPQASPQSGEKPKAQKGVYVIDKNNKVKFIEVTTGITGEADIEVTSGLTREQEIVRGPSRVLKTLKDGMKIKRQTKKPDNTNGSQS
jgi:HlyD family secretion protein